MKVKLSWFVFIPVFILLIGIKVMELMGFNQVFEFMSAPYLSVVVVFIGFIICYILSLIDKKTSFAYLLSKNLAASLFSILAASAIASKSFLSILQALLYSEYDLLVFLTSFAGLLASVSFVAISLGHLQGKNFLPKMGMVFLSISLWLCLLLIDSFLDGRVVSAVDIDPVRVFVFVFGMMLFLNLPMVIAVIEGKNPVKGTIIYGLPFACLGILSGFNTVYSIIVDGFDYSENILGFAFFFLALYSLSFLFELTRYVSDKDKYEYSFDFENYDYDEDFYGITKDEVVMAQDDNNVAPENYDYQIAEREFGDFILEKSEEVIPENIDELQLDDILVGADYDNNVSKDEDVILIQKTTAKQFENQILETNSPVVPQMSSCQVMVENSIYEVKSEPVLNFDDIKKELDFQEALEDENNSMDKIDRLLFELGSIEDI